MGICRDSGSIGNINQADIARAQKYREYMSNNAYIPLQDIPLYRKSFEMIYLKK